MPYKSEAQRRYFHVMASMGKISKATVKKWDKHTKDHKLPARVAPKKRK